MVGICHQMCATPLALYQITHSNINSKAYLVSGKMCIPLLDNNILGFVQFSLVTIRYLSNTKNSSSKQKLFLKYHIWLTLVT